MKDINEKIVNDIKALLNGEDKYEILSELCSDAINESDKLNKEYGKLCNKINDLARHNISNNEQRKRLIEAMSKLEASF